MTHLATTRIDSPKSDRLISNPKNQVLRKLQILLGLIGVLVIVVSVQHRFALRSQSARLGERREYFDQLRTQAEITRTNLIEQGRLWTGRLHEAAASDETTTGPSVMPDLTNQRRIWLDDSRIHGPGEFFGSIEMHECTPGSPNCTSGGSLTVRTREGIPVLDCAVDFLGRGDDGQSHYELKWSESAGAVSEEEKLSLLQELGGEGDALNRHEFLKEMRVAYGYEPTRKRQNDTETVVRIFRAILRSVLADRESADGTG